MRLSAVSVRVTASAGERRMRRIPLNTGAGMSIVQASGQEGILLSLNKGSASRWMKFMKMALMRVTSCHGPLRIIILRSTESVKHTK